MPKSIALINGPNLNMLAHRDSAQYGTIPLEDIERNFAALASELGYDSSIFQSNHEGALIDFVQQACALHQAIVINPGGLSHTSIALHDALECFSGSVMEVHLSNIHRREQFRRFSYVSLQADGVIAGCGAEGYLHALRQIDRLLR